MKIVAGGMMTYVADIVNVTVETSIFRRELARSMSVVEETYTFTWVMGWKGPAALRRS